jgi:hypothetical protein
MSRSELIEEAQECGIDPEVLHRTPTYSIQKLIEERKGKKRKSSKRQHHKRVLSRRSRLNHEVQRLSDEAASAGRAVDDDTMTVVDMSHITTTENPSQQKYKRFQWLVRAKNEMTRAISVNTKLSQENADNLDPDDLFMIKQDVVSAQDKLASINVEMRELKAWFQEIHQEKKVLYERIRSNMVDVSGNMATHFEEKMRNIDEYMKNLELEEERVN